jgi:hypothetical protein
MQISALEGGGRGGCKYLQWAEMTAADARGCTCSQRAKSAHGGCEHLQGAWSAGGGCECLQWVWSIRGGCGLLQWTPVLRVRAGAGFGGRSAATAGLGRGWGSLLGRAGAAQSGFCRGRNRREPDPSHHHATAGCAPGRFLIASGARARREPHPTTRPPHHPPNPHPIRTPLSERGPARGPPEAQQLNQKQQISRRQRFDWRQQPNRRHSDSREQVREQTAQRGTLKGLRATALPDSACRHTPDGAVFRMAPCS